MTKTLFSFRPLLQDAYILAKVLLGHDTDEAGGDVYFWIEQALQ